jgi:hypothetical protein
LFLSVSVHLPHFMDVNAYGKTRYLQIITIFGFSGMGSLSIRFCILKQHGRLLLYTVAIARVSLQYASCFIP